MRHFDLLQKISFKDNWMKEWDSEVAEVVETPNKSNQNQNSNHQERRDLWVDNQPVFSLSSRK